MAKELCLIVLAWIVVGCGSGAKTNPGAGSTSSAANASAPQISSPQDAAALADVPVYPGATFPNDKTQSPKRDDSGKLHIYLVMQTSDSVDKVVQFYKSTGQYGVLKEAAGQQLQGMSKKGNLVLITVQPLGKGSTIDVKSVQGG